MEEYERNIIPHIEAIYETFTDLEKTIADYFIHYDGKADLVSKNVAKRLFVSEASLSRFAKKMWIHRISRISLQLSAGANSRPSFQCQRSYQKGTKQLSGAVEQKLFPDGRSSD